MCVRVRVYVRHACILRRYGDIDEECAAEDGDG